MLASLDWLIALVFTFAFLSLLATALQELIASFFTLRAASLEKAVKGLLQGDPNLQKDFLASPFIQAMTGGTNEFPSYLKAPVFAQSIIGVLRTQAEVPDQAKATVDQMIAAAPTSLQPVLKQLMQQTIAAGTTELEVFEKELASYFNAGMERASDWFKRRTQLIIFGIAILTTLLLNADAITISRRLATDATLRDGLLTLAEKTDSTATAATIQADLKSSKIGLPFGWDLGRAQK